MQLQKILLAAVVLAAVTPASAANFSMMPGCGEDHADKSCTSIYLEGEIEPEDGGKWKLFLEKIRTPHAIVTLNSPGGSVTAALLIANDILNREYDTGYNEGICYSACTTIWLAGNDAAFEFYARLKLPEKAMTYFFSASPEQLALVTFDKAAELELKPEAWPPKKPDLQGKSEPEKLATRSNQENALVGTVAGGSPQSSEIDAIKEKIDDAQMMQKMFGGAKYCSDLDGASFYLRKDDRVVNLEEYLRSLQSLVKAGRFNQAKRRPWTPEDAQEREEEAKKLAQEDKSKCELVASLPKLEKRLQELQSAAKKVARAWSHRGTGG
jgi:hypothetical protein